MLEKYKGQIEKKFSASHHQMRIAIRSKKQFRTMNIKYIAECLNEEFENFTMLILKWVSKPSIESGCITLDFPFSVIFVRTIARTIIMSLDTVGKLCREFKILRQKNNLNIHYNLGECLKLSFDLVKVCLNCESNVDIVMERIVFECMNTCHVKSLQV